MSTTKQTATPQEVADTAEELDFVNVQIHGDAVVFTIPSFCGMYWDETNKSFEELGWSMEKVDVVGETTITIKSK